MKIVEAQEAREKLTMPVCIDLMRTALKELRKETGHSRSAPLRYFRAEKNLDLCQPG